MAPWFDEFDPYEVASGPSSVSERIALDDERMRNDTNDTGSLAWFLEAERGAEREQLLAAIEEQSTGSASCVGYFDKRTKNHKGSAVCYNWRRRNPCPVARAAMDPAERKDQEMADAFFQIEFFINALSGHHIGAGGRD